ncbi:MAG: hypothetical protein ACI4VQ_07120 [Clostridia bacterium]
MGNVKEMELVGYYSFSSKDKNNFYYVLQFLNNTDDSTKAFLINVFVDKNIYERVTEDYGIGSLLNIESSINYDTNKVYYKVVL